MIPTKAAVSNHGGTELHAVEMISYLRDSLKNNFWWCISVMIFLC